MIQKVGQVRLTSKKSVVFQKWKEEACLGLLSQCLPDPILNDSISNAYFTFEISHSIQNKHFLLNLKHVFSCLDLRGDN